MARRANTTPETQNDGDRINDGNEENTVETAAAEQARAADSSNDLGEDKGDTPNEDTEGTDAEARDRDQEGKGGDGFPRDMDSYDGAKISVETTGNFQLYDITTRTLFPADESVEVPENSAFVVRNIELGKLKKA